MIKLPSLLAALPTTRVGSSESGSGQLVRSPSQFLILIATETFFQLGNL
jgi:hypothetical protein